jgi:hypothetical protein
MNGQSSIFSITPLHLIIGGSKCEIGDWMFDRNFSMRCKENHKYHHIFLQQDTVEWQADTLPEQWITVCCFWSGAEVHIQEASEMIPTSSSNVVENTQCA